MRAQVGFKTVSPTFGRGNNRAFTDSAMNNETELLPKASIKYNV